MRRRVLWALAVIIVALGVYLTHFVLFSHTLTPTELAEAVFTTPHLAADELYIIKRHTVMASGTYHEQVYLDAYGHMWLESTGLPAQPTHSSLYLISPTKILVDRYTLTNSAQTEHTLVSQTAVHQALFGSAFYDWYSTQATTTTVTPHIARLTEWIDQIECYRVDWDTTTGSATAWIAADNFRLIREQIGVTTIDYSYSIVAAHTVPITLTLKNWEQYYNVTSANQSGAN